MRREEFEKMVEKAVQNLPKKFAEKLGNVAICVELRSSREQQKATGTKRGDVLLGLYEGISEIEWGKGFGGNVPDKITIFQESIEQFARTKAELEKLAADTVRHEIAHHFGFSEDELAERENLKTRDGSRQLPRF